MSDIIIEEFSPFGNVVAYVEDDGATVYFYLFFRDAEQSSPDRIKTCWVRNRISPPQAIDRNSMMQGQAPLMPRQFCRDASAQPPLDRGNLRIIWFEEADAAALLEGTDILAVIPGWSGSNGFNGYARDCIGEAPFAWGLQPAYDIPDRVYRAEQFWQLWNDSNFWQRWRDERIVALESNLGRHTKYYALDGGEFPPRAMLRFDDDDRSTLATVGMSLFCQPKVEQYFEDPSPYRRIELAACLHRSCPESEFMHFGQYVSAQTRYPWIQFAPLGSGHTMPCDSTPQMFGGTRFNYVALSSSLSNAPQIHFPTFRGDPTNLLWLLPITEREHDLAVEKGTASLLKSLSSAGNDFVIRNRRPTVAL